MSTVNCAEEFVLYAAEVCLATRFKLRSFTHKPNRKPNFLFISTNFVIFRKDASREMGRKNVSIWEESVWRQNRWLCQDNGNGDDKKRQQVNKKDAL